MCVSVTFACVVRKARLHKTNGGSFNKLLIRRVGQYTGCGKGVSRRKLVSKTAIKHWRQAANKINSIRNLRTETLDGGKGEGALEK